MKKKKKKKKKSTLCLYSVVYFLKETCMLEFLIETIFHPRKKPFTRWYEIAFTPLNLHHTGSWQHDWLSNIKLQYWHRNKLLQLWSGHFQHALVTQQTDVWLGVRVVAWGGGEKAQGQLSDLIIEPRVIHMWDNLMSPTAERVSSAWELLTSLRTVMVCNDVIRLWPVRQQQQGVDTQHH